MQVAFVAGLKENTMAVVISAAGFNKNDNSNAVSINYKENKSNNTSNVSQGKAVDVLSGVSIHTGDDSVRKIDENTYKSLLNEAQDVKEQIMASATAAKSSLKALCMKLSGADIVKLDEDGYNLTDADKDDMVNIIEKIKIELAMHGDGYVSFGQNIDSKTIENAVGSAGLAASIEARLNSSDINATQENVASVEGAVNKYDDIKATGISEDAKNYLVKNELEPTIDNVYQANQVSEGMSESGLGISGNKADTNAVSDEQWNQMLPQIDKIIESAGLEVNEQNRNNARAFIEASIPVTAKNLIYKNELDNITFKTDIQDDIVDNMAIGGSVGATLITDNDSILSTVKNAIDTINNADYKTVKDIISNNEVFNIANIKIYMNISIDAVLNGVALGSSTNNQADNLEHNKSGLDGNTDNNNTGNNNADNIDNADKAYLQLLETRVLMSASAGVYLSKNKVDIMSTPISELVSYLEEYDKNAVSYSYGDDYENVMEARMAVLEVADAPIEIIGHEDIFNINTTFGELAKTAVSFKRRYEMAEKTYDAVGTEVRADLGDSLNKAVKASTGDILSDLGYEDNKNNRAAVKILATNNMEMTKENIDKAKYAYQTINNLISNMKPETVLKMIRDNVNPMNTDIKELNEYLNNMNENASLENDEKFSRFLYKLDVTNQISDDERKKFIGIYQMMNIFNKDAGNAAGALIKQGAEVTMNNLISAYNSRKHYNKIDEVVNDNTGMAETYGTANYYSSLFKEHGKYVTPLNLSSIENKYGIGNQSAEEFCEELKENYDSKSEAEQYETYLRNLADNAEASENITEASDTLSQVQALNNLYESGQFPIPANSKIREELKNDRFSAIEKIGHGEELDKMYDELEDEANKNLKEAVSADADKTEITYKKLENIRAVNRQIGYIKSLALRHDYKIPYDTGNGIGMINLTFKADSDDKGRISIKMDSPSYGELSVETRISGNGAAMFVISKNSNEVSENDTDNDKDTQSNKNTINDRISDIESILKDKFDITDINTFYSKSEAVPYIKYDDAAETSSNKLYQIAQEIIKGLC